MLPTRFRIIWAKQFQRRKFLEIDQSERRIAHGGHVCQWIGRKCAILIANLPQMLPTRFRFIWPSHFREENFQKLTNQKQELAVVAILVNGSGQNEQSLQRTFHTCFIPCFGSLAQAVSEEKNLKKSANQKQLVPVVAMFVNGLGRNVQSLQRTFHRCFLPSFGSFGQAV